MKSICIAVIDSGVDKSKINSSVSINGIGLYMADNLIQYESDYYDNLGHGTIITSIIVKSLAQYTDFLQIQIVKILDKSLETQPEVLTAALEYVDSLPNIDIINVSLGTHAYSKEMERVCAKLYSSGRIVISAFDNDGAISYPAAFNTVIGVDSTSDYLKQDQYTYIDFDNVINYVGKGGMQLLLGKKIFGSSYTSAYASCVIAKLLFDHESENVFPLLKRNATATISLRKHVLMPSKYLLAATKVMVFPYNKETDVLLRRSNLLPFDIVALCDSRYSGNCGKTVDGIKIEDIDKISMDNFDSVIIGHTDKIEQRIGKSVKRTLLERCLNSKKNVYCFDHINTEGFKLLYESNDVILEIANNLQIYDYKEKLGKLYQIGTPILGVFGTGKNQGKFTLQLLLREQLINRGYKVGQLSTEPSGVLFGIERTFPTGYNSNLSISEYEFINHINELLHELECISPDIILVGCQSETIPYCTNNLRNIPIRQMEFLVATSPDCVILCFSADDEYEYIVRTISAIESIMYSKVVALMYKDEPNPNRCLLEKCKLLNMPVFTINETAVSSVVELVVNYFS